MHEELIGQEASLSLPCDVDASTLLFGFIEELMEVSGDEPADPDELESNIKAAVGAICGHNGSQGACQLVATFDIHDGGVDVKLTCETHDAADVRQVVVAREA